MREVDALKILQDLRERVCKLIDCAVVGPGFLFVAVSHALSHPLPLIIRVIHLLYDVVLLLKQYKLALHGEKELIYKFVAIDFIRFITYHIIFGFGGTELCLDTTLEVGQET